jgi:CRP/FNR family cyclic AMP-dependent transcriptional regulator
MARRANVSDLMKAVPMFAMCTTRELRVIGRLSTQRDVPAGKVLTQEGTPGREFVIVLDGEAVATRNGTEVHRFGPGDYFGEIALLDPGERTATVIAQTPMTIAVVSPSEFGDMLDEVPTLAHKVMRGLARQIRELADSAAV